MKATSIFYIILFIILVTPVISFAQSDEETLESNTEYRTYKSQLDSLLREQQLIVDEIEHYKELSEADALKKEEYISLVLKMEGQLFDLRSRMGIVSSKCGAIEQEFIIKNIGKKRPETEIVASTSKSTNHTNFLLNKFFVDNITTEEMKLINRVANVDSIAFVLRDSMRVKAELLKQISEQLRHTQRAELSDSLYTIGEEALGAVKSYEKTLMGCWNEMFDTKIYVYTRLLDKLNVSVSSLSKLSERAREVRSAKDEAEGSKFSVVFYAYPMEQQLVLSYEKILAEKLAYISSIDSLNKKIEIADAMQFEEEAIELPQWDYVLFRPVVVGGKVHSAHNPVKKMIIPTYGSVYSLRISTLTNPLASYGALRNVNPVSVFRNEAGKYEYYAGMYASKDEAVDDVAKLKRLGFTPSVVQWREGGKVVGDGMIIPLNVFENTYRVEFESVTPEITAKLKELAPGKELLRVDDKYSIGFFKNYLDAVKIKKAIGVDCKIVPLENN